MKREEAIGARQKGRPKLNEAAEFDLAIREAAINVLLEHGQAATLNSVAHAAGLSRKSVYARYASKSDLFLDVIRNLLEEAKGVEFAASSNIEEKLFNYIRAAMALISTPRARTIQRLLTDDPIYLAALKSEMTEATQRHFFNPLRNVLAEAHRNQELCVENIEGSTKAVVRLIFAECMKPDSDLQMTAGVSEQESYARFIAGLITKGLLPRDGS